jgi:hypothetical protein
LTYVEAKVSATAHPLADAVFYRDPPVECRACADRDELCDACAGGLACARAYLALGRELGMEISA